MTVSAPKLPHSPRQPTVQLLHLISPTIALPNTLPAPAAYLVDDVCRAFYSRIHPQATGHGCAPYHPQTQGKIERWHQTLKNRILLENYFLPGDLEAQIEAFVDHYNHQRYHESINNVTPADVYFGRDKAILKQRERIKRKTLEARRLHHRQHAA